MNSEREADKVVASGRRMRGGEEEEEVICYKVSLENVFIFLSRELLWLVKRMWDPLIN